MMTRVARALLSVSAALGLAGAPLAGQGSDVELHGFAEFNSGLRVREDPLQPDDFVLSETRLRLDLAHYTDRAELAFKGDFTADALTDGVDIDVRQASLTVWAADWLDMRVGRQVLTWGTGDLLFLNDLFPKDYVSFFVGRDDEFLKAPTNAVKLTFYSDMANLDLVGMPVFEPDRSVTGERLSFFDPGAGALVSAESMGGPSSPARPGRTIRNGETAARLFRTVGGYELALYGYLGFVKQPLAFDPAAGVPTYSRQAAYGASARGALAGGIAHIEGAYYDGVDDRGDNPTRPNNQLRGLVGYERELLPELTGGLQYYVEHLTDYGALLAAAPAPATEPSETRHLLTARLTRRLLRQTLTASLFAFVSPNDGDAYLRPTVSYAWSDVLTVAGGANVMLGDTPTPFGQFERASNVYVRARYAF